MATESSQYEERLAQIAHTTFGELVDDQVLQLLAERKQLQDLRLQYEQVQKVQEKVMQAEAEKASAEGELSRLNALISPEKPDDELIHLVEERKTWEAKLASAEASLIALRGGSMPSVPAPDASIEETRVTASVPEEEKEAERVIPDEPVTEPGDISVDKEFGEQRIVDSSLDPESELGRILEQIRSNPESMGKILDGLEPTVKRDKVFMLSVAEIDPAYAMHYADKDVLKKDEDFNVKVAALKGKRVSGSALAEMLPEARTAKVVLTAIKQDYRNVRYALPQMEGYDQMVERAKKSALEKVKELKESVDISLLVPKILQKDKEFMKKVEEVIPKPE